MESTVKVLQLLTGKFPPVPGTNHLIQLAIGDPEIEAMSDVNIVVQLSTEDGYLPVYLYDKELRESPEKIYEEIVKSLMALGLIEE